MGVKCKYWRPCYIYTDVDGVYTADPQIVPEARVIRHLTYEEMLELASQGTKVLHPRAVEIALIYNVSIIVRNTFSNDPGTLIDDGETSYYVEEVK